MYWIPMTILALSGIVTLAAAARRRLDVLSMPFLVSMVFVFLYVWLPLCGLDQERLFTLVTPRQVTWAITFPCAALLAFWAGWVLVVSRPPPKPPARSPRDPAEPDRLFRAGFLLALIGAGLWCGFLAFSGGALHFYSAPHGHAGRWEETTAWLYAGPYLMIPGLAFMLIALLRSGERNRWAWSIPICVAGALYVHAILTSSRGVFYPLTVTLAATPMLVVRKRPRFSTVAVGILALAAGLWVLSVYRDFLHLGTLRESIDAMDAEATLAKVHLIQEGNEFVYHTGVLSTVDAVERYGWGERYIWYLLFRPLPRICWPDKPHHLFTVGIISREDVTDVMGWVVSTGAAPTLVADWYREWGVYSLIAWIVLGAGLAALYRRAIRANASAMDILLYVAVLARGLNLIAQGFVAFVEPLLLMVIAAYLVHLVRVQIPGLRRRIPCARYRRRNHPVNLRPIA